MIVNKLSNCPLHEQIKLDVQKQIKEGILSPGGRLSSVRELASSLNINPNTVSRAYKELEKEEYIIVLPGKGIFIKNIRVDTPHPMKEKELKQAFELCLLDTHYHNVSKETIEHWLEDFYIKVGNQK